MIHVIIMIVAFVIVAGTCNYVCIVCVYAYAHVYVCMAISAWLYSMWVDVWCTCMCPRVHVQCVHCLYSVCIYVCYAYVYVCCK